MKKIIFIAMVCCAAVTKAQYKKPFFHTLTVESGLPEADIVTFLQDKLGYMWFGTQNGLVRYDGYKLKTYPVMNDEGLPVSSSIVNQLYEDRSGKLWVFYFQEGLYYYDRTKDIFLKVSLDKKIKDKLKAVDYFRKWIEDPQQQHMHWFFAHYAIENLHHLYLFDDIHNTLEDYSSMGKGKYFIPVYHGGVDLVPDANGKMWAMADSLLCYFDWKTRSFQPYFVLPDSTKKYMFSVITPDPADADILWLNTWIPGENGQTNSRSTSKFLRFNSKTKAYKIFTPHEINAAVPANYWKNIFSDSLKRTWMVTKNTIALYNNRDGSFTNFALNTLSAKDNIDVKAIASDASGNLWIGGAFKGLFYLNIKQGFASYYPVTQDPGSLPDNMYVSDIFFDRTGTLWVNMPYEGIAYMNRQRSLFAAEAVASSFIAQNKKNDPNQYRFKGFDGDGVFFVADSAGFYIWDYRQNSLNKVDLGDKSIYFSSSKAIRDPNGSIWIGSTGSGLLNYDPVTKKIKKYKSDPKDSSSISSYNFTDLLVDTNGTLWISTFDKGISRFNRETGTFKNLPFIQNDNTINQNDNTLKVMDSLDDASVICLYSDDEGMVWIGTNRGSLNRYNPSTGKFTSFLDYRSGFFCVTSIFEDSHKRLWAGTYLSGLFLVDRETGALTKYTEKDGLISNAVMGIQEDAQANIWLATARGLSKFDPGKKRFTSYPSVAVTPDPGTFLKEKNGIFNIATRRGLVSFDPAYMNESAAIFPVIIESVGYHNSNDRDTVLFIDGRNKIELNYNENRISFNYVALRFENADQNQYAYKLDGYDEDWISAGTLRTVTYTNLSAGTYTFHVKAANSDGVWNETGASFTIKILPPWWKTWWAYSLYVLLIGGSIWAFVQYRSKALRKENLVLEQKVDHRTSQLQQSLRDLKATQSQLIQSEKMASLGELTAGIAHEIQNPLNFVNNFSEVSNELIVEMNDELNKGDIDEAKNIANDIKQNLEKINHHGKRADAIVKGMLQHSRSSNGLKEPTDINALCDEYLRLSYHGLRAKDKSFNAILKTDFDESIGNINIISQDIGRVILNLLTNAFYAVAEKKKAPQPPAGGIDYEPTVTISTKRIISPLGVGGVEIKVSDNGNGIPQKVLDKIFQPFFTTKPTGQGTGLGLSLSYDIITKGHGGELKAETKEGESTSFVILLPYITNN